MKIAGFIKTTLLDWEGMVACTVYLAGCDFRCPYCHNKNIVLDPEGCDEIDETKILEYIKENRDFIDGVVVSGGEPTINKDIHKFLKKLKALGVKIKIDTNGSNPDVLNDLIGAGLVDMIAMDIKGPLNERYSSVAGTKVDVEKLKKSIQTIMDSGLEYEFRTTAVPIFIKPDDIESICRAIEGAKKYRIHQFRNKVTLDDNLSVLDPYPDSKIIEMAEIAKKYVKDVRIRGL